MPVLRPPSTFGRAHCTAAIILPFQRSADIGLRIPSDIALYALLTHMIARVTGTQPHELIVQLGDAYICRDHIEALSVLLTREPRPFATLRWTRDVTDIEDFSYGDFAVEGHFSPYDMPSIALASDPEAVRVRDWRYKIQKAFLNDKRPPKVRLFSSLTGLSGHARKQRVVHCN